jgi:hypothetical protein
MSDIIINQAFDNIDPERKKIIDKLIDKVETVNKLEEEALQYSEGVSDVAPGAYTDFIAGAHSKWVESEKIRAQIDVLNELLSEGVNELNLKIIITTLSLKLKNIKGE